MVELEGETGIAQKRRYLPALYAERAEAFAVCQQAVRQKCAVEAGNAERRQCVTIVEGTVPQALQPSADGHRRQPRILKRIGGNHIIILRQCQHTAQRSTGKGELIDIEELSLFRQRQAVALPRTAFRFGKGRGINLYSAFRQRQRRNRFSGAQGQPGRILRIQSVKDTAAVGKGQDSIARHIRKADGIAAVALGIRKHIELRLLPCEVINFRVVVVHHMGVRHIGGCKAKAVTARQGILTDLDFPIRLRLPFLPRIRSGIRPFTMPWIRPFRPSPPGSLRRPACPDEKTLQICAVREGTIADAPHTVRKLCPAEALISPEGAVRNLCHHKQTAVRRR